MYTLDKIDKMQDLIVENLGIEQAFTELCKAMTHDEKKEYFEYIIQNHELEE